MIVSSSVSFRTQTARHWYRRWVRCVSVAAVPGLCLASSCFFSPLPLPEDPTPERPNLNLDRAVPPVFQILNVSHGSTPISFTVPFTSVDGGQAVWWFLWSNWSLEGAMREKHDQAPERPADVDGGMGGAASIERTIQFSWTPSTDLEPGCNQLTLFVTHAENVNFTTLRPRDLSQAAIATYWVNVDAPLGETQTLVNCPVLAVGP